MARPDPRSSPSALVGSHLHLGFVALQPRVVAVPAVPLPLGGARGDGAEDPHPDLNASTLRAAVGGRGRSHHKVPIRGPTLVAPAWASTDRRPPASLPPGGGGQAPVVGVSRLAVCASIVVTVGPGFGGRACWSEPVWVAGVNATTVCATVNSIRSRMADLADHRGARASPGGSVGWRIQYRRTDLVFEGWTIESRTPPHRTMTVQEAALSSSQVTSTSPIPSPRALSRLWTSMAVA
jgi:hypothetical protein